MSRDMLQNRVDPIGNIIKTEARGYWMGNRGLLHDNNQQIKRQFRLKAWITCLLQFKDRKRPVMAPGQYTELFFLDEATAFAAGHRPCAECRRQDYMRFKSLWVKANPEYELSEQSSISEIDNVIHSQRINEEGNKRTYFDMAANLPDGTFVLFDNKPCLYLANSLFQWSPFGYKDPIIVATNSRLEVLTPGSIVKTFAAGYKVQSVCIL